MTACMLGLTITRALCLPPTHQPNPLGGNLSSRFIRPSIRRGKPASALVLHPAVVWELLSCQGTDTMSTIVASTQMASFGKVMDKVYGPYTKGDTSWRPKPYKEGKGRYLWTDAFGVCNFITQYCETKDDRFLQQAKLLVQEVHNVLGKSRDGAARLAGASNEHPTGGGMRIGKPDPEGTSDGDGQYFQYLTKWMFALNRLALATNSAIYNHWAVELAQAVHPKFVYNQDSDRPRMYWKMSIDLSRPAVRSEGNLDPFDGYVTYKLLQGTHHIFNAGAPAVLEAETAELKRIVDAKYPNYYSEDPLDLGEACWLAHWFPQEEWSQVVSKQSLKSLDLLWQEGYFRQSERYRLAFREFGATLGVQCNPAAQPAWKDRTSSLNSFWETQLYSRDADITPMMYCASLNPGVFQRNHSLPAGNAHGSEPH